MVYYIPFMYIISYAKSYKHIKSLSEKQINQYMAKTNELNQQWKKETRI